MFFTLTRTNGLHFCKVEIKLEDGRLSIVGEEGRKLFGRHHVDTCGQIQDRIARWFPEVKPLLKWHLNDMHAECEHQEMRGETYQNSPDAVCGDCGYKLGSAWTKRELPADVVALVESLYAQSQAVA